jgi:hypothetical protein
LAEDRLTGEDWTLFTDARKLVHLAQAGGCVKCAMVRGKFVAPPDKIELNYDKNLKLI